MYRNYLHKAFYGSQGLFMTPSSKIQPFLHDVQPDKFLGMYDYKKHMLSVINQNHYYSHAELYKTGDIVARSLVHHYYQFHRGLPINIVDVGCGFGSFGCKLMDTIERKYPEEYSHLKYIGIDISPYACKLATENLKNYKKAEILNQSIFDWHPLKEDQSGITYFISYEFLCSLPHDLYTEEKWVTEDFSLSSEPDQEAKEAMELWRKHAMNKLTNDSILNRVSALFETRSIFIPTDMIRWLNKIKNVKHSLIAIEPSFCFTDRREQNAPYFESNYYQFPVNFEFLQFAHNQLTGVNSKVIPIKKYIDLFKVSSSTECGYDPVSEANTNYNVMITD